jgi:hypothetical protein
MGIIFFIKIPDGHSLLHSFYQGLPCAFLERQHGRGGRDPWGPPIGSRGSPRTQGGIRYMRPFVCSTGERKSPAFCSPRRGPPPTGRGWLPRVKMCVRHACTAANFPLLSPLLHCSKLSSTTPEANFILEETSAYEYSQAQAHGRYHQVFPMHQVFLR